MNEDVPRVSKTFSPCFVFFFYYNFVYFKSQRLLIKQVSQVVFFIISYSRETYEKSKTVEKKHTASEVLLKS